MRLLPRQSLWTVCFLMFAVHFCRLEMLEPLWQQSANKSVEDWPVNLKFSALLEKLQVDVAFIH